MGSAGSRAEKLSAADKATLKNLAAAAHDNKSFDARSPQGSPRLADAKRLASPLTRQETTGTAVSVKVQKDDESRELTSNRIRQNQVLIVFWGGCSLAEWRLSKEGSDALFHTLDEDGSGYLDKDELTGLAEKHPDLQKGLTGPLRALLNPNLVEQAWEIMDENNDNRIDMHEWDRFVCVCSWRKLRFLEALHHLNGACFWGYGQKGSLATPHSFWGDTDAEPEPLPPEGDWGERRFSCTWVPPGEGTVPEWEFENRRWLWGHLNVYLGWARDLWYYSCQNHTLLSMFYVDEDHPLDRAERVVTEFALCGYTLMMLAGREWISAVMVASALPGACRADSTDFWDCVYHNCVCRPGYLGYCRELSCAALDARDGTHICAEYGAVDPTGKLCFGSIYNRHAWLVWAPLYVTMMVTIPSQFLNWALNMLLSSPCTVWDPTEPDYKPSCLGNFCALYMPRVWCAVFAILAVAAWITALYLSFTHTWLRLLGYPEDEAFTWTPDHWEMLILFVLGRISAYLFQLLLFVLLQFNPYAIVEDEDEPTRARLRCWARWGPLGRWHRERLDFLRAKYLPGGKHHSQDDDSDDDVRFLDERDHLIQNPTGRLSPRARMYSAIPGVHPRTLMQRAEARRMSALHPDRRGSEAAAARGLGRRRDSNRAAAVELPALSLAPAAADPPAAAAGAAPAAGADARSRRDGKRGSGGSAGAVPATRAQPAAGPKARSRSPRAGARAVQTAAGDRRGTQGGSTKSRPGASRIAPA